VGGDQWVLRSEEKGNGKQRRMMMRRRFPTLEQVMVNHQWFLKRSEDGELPTNNRPPATNHYPQPTNHYPPKQKG